jgi:elongation factor Tu
MQLFKPMVLEQGQRFTIRDGSTTLGTGVITKVMPKLNELERQLLNESKKNRDKIMAAQAEKKK